MFYPVWEVPVIGNGLVIGIIASLHVFISHFAVGGGAFFALTEQLAYNNKDEKIYNYLEKHAKTFLLVTSVFGAISGVGIWWAIGLSNPAATQVLIQNFSLYWASEWVVFAIELATFLVYYCTFKTMDRKRHLQLAWLYAISSYFTLFIINGILTFMLTSGSWTPGFKEMEVVKAFFNVGFWPALFLRMFIMGSLAGVWALFTLAQEKDVDFKTRMLRYTSKWVLPALLGAPFFLAAYLFVLPPATKDILMAGISTMGTGNFSFLAREVFLALMFGTGLLGMMLAGPVLNPKNFNKSFAVVMLVCGLGFMFAEEGSREMMRKPYSIYNYMYSNGVLKQNVDKLNKEGFITNHAFAKAEWAALPANATSEDKGQIVFRYQCVSCHTAHGSGYRSMQRLLGERDSDAIGNLLKLMRDNHKVDKDGKGVTPYHAFMPPVVGKQDEVDNLRDYLVSISPAKNGIKVGE